MWNDLGMACHNFLVTLLYAILSLNLVPIMQLIRKSCSESGLFLLIEQAPENFSWPKAKTHHVGGDIRGQVD